MNSIFKNYFINLLSEGRGHSLCEPQNTDISKTPNPRTDETRENAQRKLNSENNYRFAF